ncbi:GAF domain-containing protein [Bizionia gelidisalsuginis]|uniref:GAF domain-containing protein n=1 Tax=Bizionia gelidisalsuginis TaxID=291188 RepID=A0ABY3M9W4_9FLAO|nr:GAF domain-containing protein [Bizionia gelidisalsuginis]TYC12083.1 GAF domain-containing protein [Bizionia gelidisalsuginis]
MKDLNDNITLPFLLKISFNKLLEHYEELAESKDYHIAENAKRVLRKQQPYPILREGFTDVSLLKTHQKEVRVILQESFSEVLTNNEIKTASLPMHNFIFNASNRFKKIVEDAGDDFKLNVKNNPENDNYILACVIILKIYYHYEINFKRPLYYEIPDRNGVLRIYKILYNADFAEILKTDSAPPLTQTDFDELLDNFDDISLWKEKFPIQSYIFKGFVISNIFDVTEDQSISNIKSTLIGANKRRSNSFMGDFQSIFRLLFNMNNLNVGFSIYNKEDGFLTQVYDSSVSSYLLKSNKKVDCETIFCHHSFNALLKDKTYYSISDVDAAYEKSEGKAPQISSLKSQGIKSAIFAPIADGEELLGVLELVSPEPKVLNSISANKLIDVMPFILSAVKRSKLDEENLIQAIIQRECTGIHPSVQWKFEEAARQFIIDGYAKKENAVFKTIRFKQVYPLYGQIDVKGSSGARNLATQKDLSLQLTLVKNVIEKANAVESLPIYKQLLFQVKGYKKQLKSNFKVDTEQEVTDFFNNDIAPLFRFQLKNNESLKDDVADYFSKIDYGLGLIYYYRKSYDDTVMLINKNMSSIIDKKQVEAQKMYPHYFERFKTDGVEHNMYIGESITKTDSFNEIYLKNLRLWQLQVMCEMENAFYNKKHKYPIALDVASMVLVFNQPLSIRFRADERQFDVDGTYNARYEVVKKRVDKANIKGTDIRATQKGKLTIVYSTKDVEHEYLEYIKFLQSKTILDTELEIVELEDLQGVTGLKAIRVNILYSTTTANDKIFYTYDDLMKEISA